jgi:hypothetical protein
MPLEIATAAAPADLDALILYPLETYAVYELLDGRQVMVMRDAGSRELYAGTPEEVQNPSTAPSVTSQPQDAMVGTGETVEFSAAATGDPSPTVQWQRKTASTDWTAIDGAVTATLLVQAVASSDSGNQYRAVFTNRLGTDTTEAATLTVVATTPGGSEDWRDVVPASTDQLAVTGFARGPLLPMGIVTLLVGAAFVWMHRRRGALG